MCVLFGVALWLIIATLFGLPVSTTHSCIGGIIGMAVVAKGFKAVNWKAVGNVGCPGSSLPCFCFAFYLDFFGRAKVYSPSQEQFESCLYGLLSDRWVHDRSQRVSRSLYQRVSSPRLESLGSNPHLSGYWRGLQRGGSARLSSLHPSPRSLRHGHSSDFYFQRKRRDRKRKRGGSQVEHG